MDKLFKEVYEQICIQGITAIAYDNSIGKYHVRICPEETKEFRFGLSIGNINFDTREEAENYQKEVDKYFKIWIEGFIE